jgi:hypothetical protein
MWILVFKHRHEIEIQSKLQFHLTFELPGDRKGAPEARALGTAL